MFSGHGDPGHDFADAVGGMTVGDLGERVIHACGLMPVIFQFSMRAA
jgi:hypothetical protein